MVDVDATAINADGACNANASVERDVCRVGAMAPSQASQCVGKCVVGRVSAGISAADGRLNGDDTRASKAAGAGCGVVRVGDRAASDGG